MMDGLKCDRGFTLSPLGTFFLAIGDRLFRYWGRTSSPLGTYFLAIGEQLKLIPNKYFVNPQWQFYSIPTIHYYYREGIFSAKELRI